MLTEYKHVVKDLRKATGSFEREVTRVGKLNSKLEGIIVGLQDDKVHLKVQIGLITNSNQTNLDKIGNLKKEAINNGKMEKAKSDSVVMLHKFAVGAFKITHAEKLGIKTVEIRRLNLSLDSYRERNRRNHGT